MEQSDDIQLLRLELMKLGEIVLEAVKLSEEERASLASQLLHGLETPVYEVSDDVVRKRMREADADPSALITFEELVTGSGSVELKFHKRV